MFEPTFRVERSITISAPSQRISSQIVDFHKWANWSPWEELDPSMQREFSGPMKGVGSIYSWDGNRKAGAGRMKITKVTPTRIRLMIEFSRPMQSASQIEFVFKQQGKETKVNWIMYGKHNFLSKIMCLFVSMDSIVGKDFERGLASLRSIVEAKS